MNAAIAGQDLSGFTALMCAVYCDNLPVVRLLLHADTNLHMFDGLGFTALHLAAQHSRTEVMKLLLQRGAGANDRHEVNLFAPLMRCQETAPIKLLLDAGADVHATDFHLSNSLHHAG